MEKMKCCSCSQRNDKQNIKNYRPVSLLPICGKIFKRLIFNEMFGFFISNNLISPNQLGFKQSCVNQFMYQPIIIITRKIYKSFDGGLEVTGVLLDISKAFDKVWRKELISNVFLVIYCKFYLIF